MANRRSNAALLPRDRGQTCHKISYRKGASITITALSDHVLDRFDQLCGCLVVDRIVVKFELLELHYWLELYELYYKKIKLIKFAKSKMQKMH